MQGRPCAESELGAEGALCPYSAQEPLTDAGWAAWDTLLRCSGQLRITASGVVVGLDLNAAMTVGLALGHCPYALAELLPAGEASLVRALNERVGRES